MKVAVPPSYVIVGNLFGEGHGTASPPLPLMFAVSGNRFLLTRWGPQAAIGWLPYDYEQASLEKPRIRASSVRSVPPTWGVPGSGCQTQC